MNRITGKVPSANQSPIDCKIKCGLAISVHDCLLPFAGTERVSSVYLSPRDRLGEL